MFYISIFTSKVSDPIGIFTFHKFYKINSTSLFNFFISIFSVSYTHLDVYKRQIIGSSEEEKNMKKDKYIRFSEMWSQIDSTAARYFYPRLEHIGLTRGQPKMLRFLGKNDGCRQKDIADRFYLRAASVSGILDTLEKDGLIERRRNPRSRRETLVFLTELGKKKLSQVCLLYTSCRLFGPL